MSNMNEANQIYKQENRLLHISDVGMEKDTLLITKLSGTEYISKLYSFEITVLSADLKIQPENIVGKDVTVTLQDSQKRCFHGYINHFVYGEMANDSLREYRFTMVPWLWFLSQTNDHRIFQHKNTKDIVSQILTDYGFNDFEFLANGGAEREYCVQHNESDLDFITRLLAEDGISYYFQHSKNKHTLKIVDSQHIYDMCSETDLQCGHVGQTNSLIMKWEHQHFFRKGSWSLNDYDFQTPEKDLRSQTATLSKFDKNTSYEHYEYPGLYGSKLGTTLVKMRMEAEEKQRHQINGASGYSQLCAGGRFNLGTNFAENEKGSYVLTSVTHTAINDTYINTRSKAELDYVNQFTCVPDTVVILPEPVDRPTMRGPQTAIVVGPEGEEIYTDEFGRVKVQFIWDREGKKNECSTCFLRVAQTWAGRKWGAYFYPRVGHEVIVDFYDGDPDRPFISGSIYNGKNLPPYTSKTLSGIKSHSTKGGTANNFNEIRFDDKKGMEQLFVHGEKDMDIMVGNDRREHVFRDRHKTVEQDQYEITKRDHHIVVGKDRLDEVQNSSFLRVAKDYVSKIGQNIMRIVGGGEIYKTMGSRTREVHGSEGIDIKLSRSVTVGKELLHKGPNLVYESDEELTIKGPGGFIKIDSSGVTIVGSKVKINEGGSAGVAEAVASSQPKEAEKPRVADAAVDGR